MTPESARADGEAVLETLSTEARRYGVALAGLVWSDGHFQAQRDPASGAAALLAEWRCSGRRVNIVLRPDGHIYAECDLLIDHPERAGWWMDTLAAWGRLPKLRVEPNLLEKPA